MWWDALSSLGVSVIRVRRLIGVGEIGSRQEAEERSFPSCVLHANVSGFIAEHVAMAVACVLRVGAGFTVVRVFHIFLGQSA